MTVRQIQIPGGGDAPVSWTVPGDWPVQPHVITALFDASAAASDVQPTIDVYSEGGALVGRVFPSSVIAAGDTSEVSYFPFSGGIGAGGVAAATSPEATTPQVVPIFAANFGPYYGSGWTQVTVDTAVRSNAVRINQSGSHTAAVNDYFTNMVTLGPQGSIWGAIVGMKLDSNGGQFKMSLGSVATPNPYRPAPNEGTLTEDTPTWLEFAQVVDTYSPVPLDSTFNGTVFQVRLLGADGAPATAITANGDTYTGFDTIDGGAGVYSLRLRCSGKNAASSAYRCPITYLALVRLDDLGQF